MSSHYQAGSMLVPFFPDVHNQLVKVWSADPLLPCGRCRSPRVCVHAPHPVDCQHTPVSCFSQDPWCRYQPTLQAVQDDGPSGQQSLVLGWGRNVLPASHGGATGFPGQTPAVPGGRGHHSRHYQRSECGDRLCSYGNNVRCSGDRPIHGLLW